jgi:drug/metabolite transporter (DMT)-like permease
MALPPEFPRDNRAAAIMLLVGTTFIFALGDATAKLTVSTMPPAQMFFVRCLVVALITVPIAVMRIGRQAFISEHPFLQLLRGFSVMFSSLCFITGLSFLPLADASAINFIWPILITVWSVIFLGEKVGIRRWSATLVGFLGMLIIVRPGTSAFQWAAVFPLAAAVLWSIAAVVTRAVSDRDRAETTLVWSSLVMLAGGAVIAPFVWVAPSPRDWMLMIGIGLLSVLGHSMLAYAYERASAAALAPYSYLQLVWATSLGYLIFGTIPDAWIAGGATLIVASGIYTVHRERIRAAEARAALREAQNVERGG